MVKTGCEIDTSKVLDMFKSFDEKSRKKVFRSTLKKAAGILTKEAKKKLREEVGAVADNPNSWNNKRLHEGIRSNVAKNNRMVKVNIMADFRLKFFEKGTKERSSSRRYGRSMRKKANRGRMKATYFFKKAKTASEEKVFSSISKNLAKAIERINKKQHE